jgi:hypothetical protein
MYFISGPIYNVYSQEQYLANVRSCIARDEALADRLSLSIYKIR